MTSSGFHIFQYNREGFLHKTIDPGFLPGIFQGGKSLWGGQTASGGEEGGAPPAPAVEESQI